MIFHDHAHSYGYFQKAKQEVVLGMRVGNALVSSSGQKPERKEVDHPSIGSMQRIASKASD
jgi:hypothetical protein